MASRSGHLEVKKVLVEIVLHMFTCKYTQATTSRILFPSSSPCLPQMLVITLFALPFMRNISFTDKNNFESLRWVMKNGIELQGLKLNLTEVKVVSDSVTEADSLLWHLMDRAIVDIEEMYAERSTAKDTTHFCEELEEVVPTLFTATHRACVNVVRSVMEREVNVDKTISEDD